MATPTSVAISEEIRQLGKRRVLEIPKMLEFHQWLDGKRLARSSCRVIGESRTGKTVNCDTYHLKRRATQHPGQAPTLPVVYWHCPDNLSVSVFFSGLLECFRYQGTRGRLSELRQRLYQVLHSCQVEMLIFDEAQRAPAKVLSEIRDISDLCDICVVLVGTDRLNTVLGRDEQVINRFLPCYRFSSLNPDELLEMTAFWEKHVLQLPEPSELTTSKAQSMLFQVTRGYIGLLDQILRESAIRALQQQRTSIDLVTLKSVIMECM